MRSRAEVQSLLDALEGKNGDLKRETRSVVLPLLRWVLRRGEASDCCDDVAGVLVKESETEGRP